MNPRLHSKVIPHIRGKSNYIVLVNCAQCGNQMFLAREPARNDAETKYREAKATATKLCCPSCTNSSKRYAVILWRQEILKAEEVTGGSIVVAPSVVKVR